MTLCLLMLVLKPTVLTLTFEIGENFHTTRFTIKEPHPYGVGVDVQFTSGFVELKSVVHAVNHMVAVRTLEPIFGLLREMVVGIQFFVEWEALVVDIDFPATQLQQMTFKNLLVFHHFRRTQIAVG